MFSPLATLLNYLFPTAPAKLFIPNYVPYIKCRVPGARYRLPLRPIRECGNQVTILSAIRDGRDITQTFIGMAGPNVDFFGQEMVLNDAFKYLTVMYMMDGQLVERTYLAGDVIDFHYGLKIGTARPELYTSRLGYLDLAGVQ